MSLFQWSADRYETINYGKVETFDLLVRNDSESRFDVLTQVDNAEGRLYLSLNHMEPVGANTSALLARDVATYGRPFHVQIVSNTTNRLPLTIILELKGGGAVLSRFTETQFSVHE